MWRTCCSCSPARRSDRLSIPNYEVTKYLVLATRFGKVKKTALAESICRARASLIAVRLMTDENGEVADELIGRAVQRRGRHHPHLQARHSLKFAADDDQLRPMGRQTAGVQGASSATATSCSRWT
ncbi:MAG: hypothetical protein ACLT4Y_07245 [Bifidobacterium breve]